MCFLGIFGIILMIIECELTFNKIDHKNTTFSLLLKATITFTTIILVGLVFYYHRIDITLYCVDNSIDDWRIALTRKKLFLIILEAFICMIHPIPGHFIIEWGSQYVKKVDNDINYINPYQSSHINPPSILNSTIIPKIILTTNTTTNLAQPYVPIDVMLSLPSKSK
jgi:potassium intermediate/small conductance calcium-activated channel subfamily N